MRAVQVARNVDKRRDFMTVFVAPSYNDGALQRSRNYSRLYGIGQCTSSKWRDLGINQEVILYQIRDALLAGAVGGRERV